MTPEKPDLRPYDGKHCVVTGGASFIGSHLAEALVSAGADVSVIDDFSSGSRQNLLEISEKIRVVEADAGDEKSLRALLSRGSIVFHLAAVHGGRGFIDTNPAAVLSNLSLDWNVFKTCADVGVTRVVHASSACAYPVQLQEDPNSDLLLEESEAGFHEPGKAFPDGAYGWAKLMGEYQLHTLCSESEMTGRSARIFTAYGSRENESHAMVALVAKALLKMDPFPIWGNGTQTRNFTHVKDTVHGLLLLGNDQRNLSFDVMNLGTDQHHSIIATLEVIFDVVDWRPDGIDFQLNMPVGVKSRAASNAKIQNVFGWAPSIGLRQGVIELVEWYKSYRLPGLNATELQARLLSR